jgi:hypothetical protein
MSRPHIPAELRERIVAAARNRCGYCLSDGTIIGMGLQLDHLQPFADGGATIEENLWLACADCNRFRQDRTVVPDPLTQAMVRFFNPRLDAWDRHFVWLLDGLLVLGTTPTGRATVAALRLNRSILVQARRKWIEVGWHPPRD